MELFIPDGGTAPHSIWVPIDSADTIYTGSIVTSTADGVGPVGAAAGAADTTGKAIIRGLVLATNDDVPTLNTTYMNHSVAGVTTQAAQVARAWYGNEGQWAKNDPQPLVKIALLTPQTMIKARLYNSSWGTAPTVLTVTTGSATGLGFTSNACDFTPVADLCTSYCRSGANAGLMRISDDTSTTVETNDIAFPQDIAVGDTFVRVPLRPFGDSYVQMDTESLFFDVSASPATDYYAINVIELNLKEAGNEYVIFTFASVHFDGHRA